MLIVAFGGCGGDGSTLAAPGTPTSLAVEATPDSYLSETLTWSPPTTGGPPASYEVYRSTTAGTAFQSDNHLISITAAAGQGTYEFIDNAGLGPVDTYWVVSAKNAAGESATAEVTKKPIAPPGHGGGGGGGGGDEGFGNNFAAALVFADDIGIGGAAITGAWTTDVATLDRNTGLRPTAEEVLPATVTALPYLDPATTFLLGGVTYYKQQTASTWQGQWEKGASAAQHVTAKWGDNLISQKLTANSVVRIEMVLSKALTTPMKSYTMKSLYGSRRNEIYGADGTSYDNLTAFVFASNAHLKIQKMEGGVPVGAPLYDQRLWMGDGPGYLAGEVNVAGNFTYGFVWMLNQLVLPPDIPSKTGTWRITFSLDAQNPVNQAQNNTFIDTATNGVWVSNTEVYIDIVVQ